MTQDTILNILKTIPYPGFSRDIVSFGVVKSISIEKNKVSLLLLVNTQDESIPKKIFDACHKALDPHPQIDFLSIEIDVKTPTQPSEGKQSIPRVKSIIAVGSGKGGVGKSTVASNLAVSLAQQGFRVGLCDCDLYGPSTAHMLGTHQPPLANEEGQIIPIPAHGIVFMSMGLLLNDDSPVIVRGPLATRYTQQFLHNVAWNALDYLILDLPPGTGDIQLTIVQTIALSGAIIVTTPQEIALLDARKAISMFDKVNVPIIGLVENMAWFECSCGTRHFLFGKNGGSKEAKKLKIPLLAQLPIDPQTQIHSDAGSPACLVEHSTAHTAYSHLARQVASMELTTS